jgi:hypothetical protein
MNAPANDVTVVGIFDSPAAARTAVDTLRGRNLAIRDVSVVERDPARYDPALDYSDAGWEYREYTTEELGGSGTASGLLVGSLAGTALGTLAGLGALVIPGIGPVIAAGPLVGALLGGTAGAVTGTLIGALVDVFQVPEQHATVYRERLHQGNTMVAIHVDPAHAAYVRDALRTGGAERFDWGNSYQYTYDNYNAWPGTVRAEERQPYVWVD